MLGDLTCLKYTSLLANCYASVHRAEKKRSKPGKLETGEKECRNWQVMEKCTLHPPLACHKCAVLNGNPVTANGLEARGANQLRKAIFYRGMQ